MLNGKHIGKRSAAGWYCWDCNITLCRNKDEIHGADSVWFKDCPKCGKKPNVENLESSSVGRELGFNKSKPKRKKGVTSCSSFSWATSPEKFHKSRTKFIKDEYSRRYSRKEFESVLKECPIQYTSSIGEEFS